MKIIDKLRKELERLKKLEPPREYNFWVWKDNIEQQGEIRKRIDAVENRGK